MELAGKILLVLMVPERKGYWQAISLYDVIPMQDDNMLHVTVTTYSVHDIHVQIGPT